MDGLLDFVFGALEVKESFASSSTKITVQSNKIRKYDVRSHIGDFPSVKDDLRLSNYEECPYEFYYEKAKLSADKKYGLNQIAARWPSGAVAQFFFY